jgi:serine/threonine-protein kinase
MPEDLRVPGYEMLRKLGSGSAGTVYKARQISMDRPVAVKVLPAAFADDERFIERFYREARAVAKLNHPNIVTGIDVGSAGPGVYYFVMEYVDGEEAADRVARDGPMPEKEALDVAKQMAKALDHAFKNGIIHGDVKPANIMLAREGTAKLADLGVARQTGADAGSAGGGVFGTPYYMSPEQARGEADVDIRSDIYSLGATLYHLLAGKPPFHGDPPAVVMAKQIAEEPEDIRSISPGVSRDAVALVAHMMAKDRDDRPEMPVDLIAEIDRVAKGQPAPGARAAARSVPHHGQADRHRRHPGESVATSRSKGVVAGTALGGLVLAGAIALALTMGSTDDVNGKAPPITPLVTPRVRRVPIHENPLDDAPKVDHDAEARKALEEALGLLETDLAPQEKLGALRRIVTGFPGTKAAEVAAEHARGIEAEMEAARGRERVAREVGRLGERAKELVADGKLAPAVRSVDPSAAEGALRDALTALRREIHSLGILEVARTEASALRLSEEGRIAEARRELTALDVGGVEKLEERLGEAMARVDEIERAKADTASKERSRAADEAYAALCEKVNAELRAFRPDEAKHLLSSARADKVLAPARERIEEDLTHVGYFAEAARAALRGGENLTGQTRTFAMRDGTLTKGLVQTATDNAIEVETHIKGSGASLTRKLGLSDLADREIAKLAFIILDNNEGETFLKLAVLYAVGGDIKAARRQLDKARELGADVASVERRWLAVASDEAIAARLLGEARAHYKAGRYAKARDILVKLRDEYSDTETYKQNYSSSGKKGRAAKSDSAAKVGHLLAEYWSGIEGYEVMNLTRSSAFEGKASHTQRLTEFETEANRDNSYGTRVRGYLIPPADGEYVFWVYADDQADFWLSTDDSRANKRKIASSPSYTKRRQWDKHDEQESRPVRLRRGVRYYVEVLHKEGVGSDFVGVGWRLPDGTLERPIPGNRLAPLE